MPGPWRRQQRLAGFATSAWILVAKKPFASIKLGRIPSAGKKLRCPLDRPSQEREAEPWHGKPPAIRKETNSSTHLGLHHTPTRSSRPHPLHSPPKPTMPFTASWLQPKPKWRRIRLSPIVSLLARAMVCREAGVPRARREGKCGGRTPTVIPHASQNRHAASLGD